MTADSPRKLGAVLVELGAITSEDLDEALKDQNAGNPFRLGELLLSRGKITTDALGRALAVRHGLPFVELPRPLPPIASKVPLSILQQHNLVAFDETAEGISVALVDPSEHEGVEKLMAMYARPLKLHVASLDDVVAAIHALQNAPKGKPGDVPRPASAPRPAAPASAQRPLGRVGVRKVAVKAEVPLELPAWIHRDNDASPTREGLDSFPEWVKAEADAPETSFDYSVLHALEEGREPETGNPLGPDAELKVAAAVRQLIERGLLNPQRLMVQLIPAMGDDEELIISEE